jgi:hypothetical protein
VLALVAAIAAGVVAFRTLGGGDDGPAAHSYALPYLAPSGAYRAMLPCSPDVSEQSVSLGNGASVLARMALCDFDDHAVIVGDATYPPGVPVPSPDLALRGAADGAAISSNGVVANFHQVDHDGLAAADVEVEAQGAHVRMRVVVAGTSSGQPSIVMAMVGSQGGARDADFDRLVEHLSVVP